MGLIPPPVKVFLILMLLTRLRYINFSVEVEVFEKNHIISRVFEGENSQSLQL